MMVTKIGQVAEWASVVQHKIKTTVKDNRSSSKEADIVKMIAMVQTPSLSTTNAFPATQNFVLSYSRSVFLLYSRHSPTP